VVCFNGGKLLKSKAICAPLTGPKILNRIILDTENQLGVSKNRGTPKWMVYEGKPY